MKPRAVLVLFGPKGVGKSHVARLLHRTLDVHHIDADPLILDLIGKGIQPDPKYGWLEPVQNSVEDALEEHAVVAVEATGAWPTDWEIVDRLKNGGVVVLCVRITAPREVAAARLGSRQGARVPVTDADADWIYDQAMTNSATRNFDFVIDTTQDLDEESLASQVQRLIDDALIREGA